MSISIPGADYTPQLTGYTGRYYVGNSKATTISISNLPNGFPETNFALRVEKLGTTNGVKQTLYSGNNTNRAWVRNLYENYISSWREIQYVDEG